MTTRAQAIEPVLDTLSRESGCSRDVVLDLLRGWTVTPYLLGGEVAASAIMLGTEIHFAVDPRYRKRLLTRARIREFLGPLLAKRGYLTTRHLVGHDSSAEVLFIRRLGFRPTWSAGDTTHYMLTSLPFERGQP